MSQASPENKHPENQAAMSEADLAALRQLHRVIDEEMRKPPEEQDEELISECIGTIAEIKGVKGSFSAEEIDEQIAIVKAKAAQEKAARQPMRIRKPMLIAACAALLVAVSVLTVCATPILRAWFVQLRQYGAGATAEDQGLTYEYMGKSEVYNSEVYNNIEELLAAEDIRICYPTELPDGVLIKRIVCMNVDNKIIYSITFNTDEISMRIQADQTSLLPSNAKREEYITPVGVFYIQDKKNKISAVGLINESLYTISVNNIDSLKTILDSLKENIE